jgi:hypothetical protein
VALPTVPLAGKVTYQAKPLEGGQIVFVHELGQAVAASIAADGTYNVIAFQGKNLVAVSSLSTEPPVSNPNARPTAPPRKSLIPERYTSCNTSNLTFDAQADSNRFDIDLKP